MRRTLRILFDLDHATNDRLLSENGFLAGIGVDELVFGVPYCRIVNAVFTHAHPLGLAIQRPRSWCMVRIVRSSQLRTRRSPFIKRSNTRRSGDLDDSVTFDDYLADFGAEFHDLRNGTGFAACLAPDTYVASQSLARRLFDMGSLGIVYPSVRHASGTCLACFRPTLVGNVRKHRTYRFTWRGTPVPAIETVEHPVGKDRTRSAAR